MRVPRIPIVLAACGSLLAGAAPPAGAAARPAAGWYGGKVGGAVVAFRVAPDGMLRSLRTGGLLATCDDGTHRMATITGLSRRWGTSARTGRFSSRTRVGQGAARGTLSLAGTFTGSQRARGTLRVRFGYPGGPSCDTKARSFSATRRRAEPIVPLAPRIFAGRTADGSLLEIQMAPDGTALGPLRMRGTMACSSGGSVTLDVHPGGNYTAITGARTFSGAWRFMPPTISGHAAPSGGAVQLSGRVTASGLDGAARLSIGFMDGSSCDGGWTRFTFAGNTATTVG